MVQGHLDLNQMGHSPGISSFGTGQIGESRVFLLQRQDFIVQLAPNGKLPGNFLFGAGPVQSSSQPSQAPSALGGNISEKLALDFYKVN